MRRRNRCYYSDDHGYVCDCRKRDEPYEQLCPLCQEQVDAEREEEGEEEPDM